MHLCAGSTDQATPARDVGDVRYSSDALRSSYSLAQSLRVAYTQEQVTHTRAQCTHLWVAAFVRPSAVPPEKELLGRDDPAATLVDWTCLAG